MIYTILQTPDFVKHILNEIVFESDIFLDFISIEIVFDLERNLFDVKN